MKLMAFSVALIIALLSLSPVMAGDSVFLEERMQRLHDKANTSIEAPTTMQQRMGPRTSGARGAPAATVESPEPWWH